jgi:hypothetical protein
MSTAQNRQKIIKDKELPIIRTHTQAFSSFLKTPIKNKKSKFILPILVIILIAVAGKVYYVYKSMQPQGITESHQSRPELTAKNPTATPQPIRTPIPLYPDNGTKGTYNISQGTHNGPTFSQVIFDPLNAQKGQTFTITVTFKEKGAVTGLTGVLKTDNSSTNMTFQKVENTQIETWQTSFTLNDSVLYSYILNLTATSTGGSSLITVAPRS